MNNHQTSQTPATFKVTVERYDPLQQRSFEQSYQVDFVPSQTVLQTLNFIRDRLDDSLSYRLSCQGGKCGSCAVALNGKPVLACCTMVDGADIRISPLPNFPIINDLIIDRSACEEYYFEMLSHSGHCSGDCASEPPTRQPQATLAESRIDYDNLSRCIGCLVCTSACPYHAQLNKQGPNPSMLVSVLSSGVLTKEQAFPIGSNSDYCSLCLNCYSACPAGVHLNRANAQGKDAWTQTQGQKLRDRLLGHAELADKLASTTPALNNAIVANQGVRTLLEKTLGISRQPSMVKFSRPLQQERALDSAPKATDKAHKVVFFSGCYARYNETSIAKDSIAVLERLGIDVAVPDLSCCGLPLLGNGDFAAAQKKALNNVSRLQPWLDQGYAIVSSCTSCSMMLKSEYTEVFGISAAETLAERSYDLAEYLLKLENEGAIELKLKAVAGQSAYHQPCHLKSQKIGQPFVELLQRIPEFQVEQLSADCCGQSGSYGYKAEKYPLSSAVASELKEQLKQSGAPLGLSECGPCQLRMHDVAGVEVKHPVAILRRALG